jgi:hypothetical protein
LKPKNDKLPITPRALLQRINRKLREQGQKVVAQRGNEYRRVNRNGQETYVQGARYRTGHYYRIRLDESAMLERDVDLAKLGAKLGCLKGYEVLG